MTSRDQILRCADAQSSLSNSARVGTSYLTTLLCEGWLPFVFATASALRELKCREGRSPLTSDSIQDPPAFNCSSSMPPVDAPGASPAATQYALRPVAAARSPWRGQGRRLPAYSHNPLTTGIAYSRMCVSTNFKGASWMPYMDKSRLEYPAMFTGSACPPSLALWEQRVGGDGRAHPATPLALAPAGARARGGPEGQACLRL